MASTHFDEITRSLAQSGSRRRVLAGLASGVLGLLGVRRLDARTCGAPGAICREDATCCSGICGARDRYGRRRCHCRNAADCPTPSGGGVTYCLDGVCQIEKESTCNAQIFAGPPAQAVFSVQEPSPGLGSIVVTQSENADTVVPPFTVATTDPVVVTSIKIDQSQNARIEMQVSNINGTIRIGSLTF